jgi:hypothetical protein
MRLGRMTCNQSLTQICTNQTTSWLVHSWNIFGVRTSHRQTWTHTTHHGSDLGEATTFPLVVYFVPGHRTSTRMTFCPGLPSGSSKIPKVGTLAILGAHNSVCKPLIAMKFEEKL